MNKIKFISILFVASLLFFIYWIYSTYYAPNVLISANADGINVFIDKTFMGKTPLAVRLEPKTYTILFQKEGVVQKKETINVTESGTNNYNFKLLEGFRYIKGRHFNFHGKEMQLKGFYLSETEVTNQLYLEFCNETGNPLPYYANRDFLMQNEQPVLGINYEDAVAFTKWYSKKTGYICRLPYESEWEFAASGGNPNNIYPWGNLEKNGSQFLANYHPFDFENEQLLPKESDGFQFTSPVKSYPHTVNHLYDMAGNVFEWTLDTITDPMEYPEYSLKKTPVEHARIVKGGCWSFNQKILEIKYRVFADGRIREGNSGIRLLIEKPRE